MKTWEEQTHQDEQAHKRNTSQAAETAEHTEEETRTNNEDMEVPTTQQAEIEAQADRTVSHEDRREEEIRPEATNASHQERNEPETSENEYEEQGHYTQQILNYITGNTDPEGTEEQLMELLNQNSRRDEDWDPNKEVIQSLHILDNKTLTRRGYTCLECERQFESEQSLFTHMKKEHRVPRTDWFTLALRNKDKSSSGHYGKGRTTNDTGALDM